MRWLLVVALLLAVLPQPARAHGGHEQEAAPAVVIQEISAPCLPGSGHVCGCGNLSLCSVRGNAAVVAHFVSYVVAPGPSARIVSHPPAPPSARPDLAPPSSRAPPLAL